MSEEIGGNRFVCVRFISAYVPSSYAFNPMSSYAYVPKYAATNYVPRYAYAPKDTVTFQATQLLSYASTLQDTFRLRYNIKKSLSIPSQATLTFQDLQLRLRFKIHSHKDAFESLKISFPQD